MMHGVSGIEQGLLGRNAMVGLVLQVAAAHVCYLIADANLESYSGNARLCLIGADHCKNPRTFVTAEAIQASILVSGNRVAWSACFALCLYDVDIHRIEVF